MLLEELLSHISSSPELLLAAGFIVGMMHAFEPDHITAIMTQVRDGRRENHDAGSAVQGLATLKNSLLGVAWGFGHTSMIFLVSLLVFVAALSIPSVLFDGFEFMVGVMLVVLGMLMYRKKMGHTHPHEHENGVVHTHPHEHDVLHMHTHRHYLIGCLHGLAGSGGLIALGAMTQGVSGMLWFVLLFGLGSVIGMMIVSGTLSIPFQMSYGFGRLRKWMQIMTGTITIVIGLGIIYGIVESGRLGDFL